MGLNSGQQMMLSSQMRRVNRGMYMQHQADHSEDSGFALFLALLVGGFFFPPLWILLLLWGLSKIF
jgi:hypothetical protein